MVSIFFFLLVYVSVCSQKICSIITGENVLMWSAAVQFFFYLHDLVEGSINLQKFPDTDVTTGIATKI